MINWKLGCILIFCFYSCGDSCTIVGDMSQIGKTHMDFCFGESIVIGSDLSSWEKENKFYSEDDSYKTKCQNIEIRKIIDEFHFEDEIIRVYLEYFFWDNVLYAYKASFFLPEESKSYFKSKIESYCINKNLGDHIISNYGFASGTFVYEIIIKHAISKQIEKYYKYTIIR